MDRAFTCTYTHSLGCCVIGHLLNISRFFCLFLERRSHRTQDSLSVAAMQPRMTKFLGLPPLPLKFCDYSHGPPSPDDVFLFEIEAVFKM